MCVKCEGLLAGCASELLVVDEQRVSGAGLEYPVLTGAVSESEHGA